LRKWLLLVAAGWLASILPGFGQGQDATTARDATSKAPAFEVVSVKPSNSDNSYWKTNPDGFSASVPLLGLVMSAYGIHMLDQLTGLPGWGMSMRFQIDAKIDADDAALDKLSKDDANKERQLMLQSLLAERFNFKAHRVTKEGQIYALVLPKADQSSKSPPATRT
jgi:uncharacterized protein (TIGR03435 family)